MKSTETAAGYSRLPPSQGLSDIDDDSIPMLDDLDDVPDIGNIHAAAIQQTMTALDAHMNKQEELKARIAEELAGLELTKSTRRLLLDIQAFFGESV
jgi:hypothetical protein